MKTIEEIQSAVVLRVMTAVIKDDTELFEQFMDNEDFKGWITDKVFGLTCGADAGAGAP